jgi:hypothetical protein
MNTKRHKHTHNLMPLAFESIEEAIKLLNLDRNIDNAFIDILKYLKEQHGANSILIEHNYYDRHFTNELSNLYSKTFRYRKGYCERLHFIKEQITSSDEFVNKLLQDEITYLGFIVRRPLEVGKVGYTVILPKHIDNLYCLCILQKDVHLQGKTIQVKGAPFIEQDSMVMTCAQASMWIVANIMHQNHNFPIKLPYEITDKATTNFSFIGRAIPSSGLTSEQIVFGLHNMGYFPIRYFKPTWGDYNKGENPKREKDLYNQDRELWRPWDKIYSYLESEIPILIELPDHVCTVIGHKMYNGTKDVGLDKIIDRLKKEEKNSRKTNPNHIRPAVISSSIFIDAFMVHDDQDGIYKLLPCGGECLSFFKKTHKNLLSKHRDRFKRRVKYTTLDDVEGIIIPLPDKIYLDADNIFFMSERLFFEEGQKRLPILNMLAEEGKKGNDFAQELLSSRLISVKNPIIIRSYFLRSFRFKKSINKNEYIHNQIKEYYLDMDMPRFIWVSEVSTYFIYSNEKSILGEIVFDPTSNKYDIYGSLLSVHLPGMFWQNEAYSREPLTGIPQEKPYQILIRDNKYDCKII